MSDDTTSTQELIEQMRAEIARIRATGKSHPVLVCGLLESAVSRLSAIEAARKAGLSGGFSALGRSIQKTIQEGVDAAIAVQVAAAKAKAAGPHWNPDWEPTTPPPPVHDGPIKPQTPAPTVDALGIRRDRTVDARNDVQFFHEEFTGILDPVERLLRKLENLPLESGFRLYSISLSPNDTSQPNSYRCVSFVEAERYDVHFHAPTLLGALRAADNYITRQGVHR